MSTEDFVSYRQAVKLKECGFDREVKFHYDVVRNNNRITKYFPAPTLAQAAKWLREVKGIHVAASLNCTGYWFAEVIRIKDLKDLLQDGNMYDTYELALSHGIDVCLNFLIEKQ